MRGISSAVQTPALSRQLVLLRASGTGQTNHERIDLEELPEDPAEQVSHSGGNAAER